MTRAVNDHIKKMLRKAFMAGAAAESHASFESVIVHIGDENGVERCSRRSAAFDRWWRRGRR